MDVYYVSFETGLVIDGLKTPNGMMTSIVYRVQVSQWTPGHIDE